VTRQDLGNASTTIVTDGAELVIERTFDAPRELVWTAMTSPEHIPRWLGPHGTTTTIVEWDLRPGGKWRWINGSDGAQARFKGEFLEVVPPERIVRTAIFDVEPVGPPAVETITFEVLDGKTKVHWHARFPSEEVLDFAVSTGMSKGVLEQFDRLAQLLAKLG
jgi:uncharacterized protein YndB with AHSA1/START domain